MDKLIQVQIDGKIIFHHKIMNDATHNTVQIFRAINLDFLNSGHWRGVVFREVV